jgi:hypothetical protein
MATKPGSGANAGARFYGENALEKSSGPRIKERKNVQTGQLSAEWVDFKALTVKQTIRRQPVLSNKRADKAE